MITGAQHGRHDKEWSAACTAQGWNPKDAAKRLEFYRENNLPESRRDWRPREDFDTFLDAVALLQHKLPIVDRERERIELGIVRLAAAIGEILNEEPEAYIASIVFDMSDIEDWRNLPLNPRSEQQERGAVRRKWRSEGDDYSPGIAPDLENLRDTLKVRLSKLLTKIKAGRVACPHARDWYLVCANNPVISAVLVNKVCLPGIGRGEYVYCTPRQYELQRAKTAAARAVQPAPAFALETTPPASVNVFTEVTKKARESKGRPAMRVSEEILANLLSDEIPDMPF